MFDYARLSPNNIYIVEYIRDIKYISLYITKKNFNKFPTHFFRDTILFLFVIHKWIVAIATSTIELPSVSLLIIR